MSNLKELYAKNNPYRVSKRNFLIRSLEDYEKAKKWRVSENSFCKYREVSFGDNLYLQVECYWRDEI